MSDHPYFKHLFFLVKERIITYETMRILTVKDLEILIDQMRKK